MRCTHNDSRRMFIAMRLICVMIYKHIIALISCDSFLIDNSVVIVMSKLNEITRKKINYNVITQEITRNLQLIMQTMNRKY